MARRSRKKDRLSSSFLEQEKERTPLEYRRNSLSPEERRELGLAAIHRLSSTLDIFTIHDLSPRIGADYTEHEMLVLLSIAEQRGIIRKHPCQMDSWARAT